jgi:hypothetical protein
VTVIPHGGFDAGQVRDTKALAVRQKTARAGRGGSARPLTRSSDTFLRACARSAHARHNSTRRSVDELHSGSTSKLTVCSHYTSVMYAGHTVNKSQYLQNDPRLTPK